MIIENQRSKESKEIILIFMPQRILYENNEDK
jgi:hypothetical protein